MDGSTLRLALGNADADRSKLVLIFRKTTGTPMSEAARLADSLIAGETIEIVDSSGRLARTAVQHGLSVEALEHPREPIRAVSGALSVSHADAGVIYNFLTPDMKAFLAKCVGAAKARGLAVTGSPSFSVLLGDGREVRLEKYFDCEDMEGSFERAVAAIASAASGRAKPWWKVW
jgi:hypothetical protein